VRFIGRPRLQVALKSNGLRVTDYLGVDHTIDADQIDFSTTAEAAAGVDFVFVTVKSAATAEAGKALREVLMPGTVVISFQNGLHSAEVLRQVLPGVTVLTGMVPFNVLARGQGHFHQGSEGALAVQANPALAPLQACFARVRLPIAEHADMRAVQWAKLLLNLNNAINALSGVPLKQELSQRAFRRCLALAQRETLDLLSAASIPLAQLTQLPAKRIPLLLSVPDFLFRRFAGKMVAIDPLARSSMWEDLEAGRATEVDYINGEVLRLATSLGRTAPVNARLVELVRDAEKGGRRGWQAKALFDELRRARRG
jgi:2-dehydropantoate 2-reductase